MSSSSKGGRSNKGTRGRTNKNMGGSTHIELSKSDHNHNDKDNVPHKIAPTVDQLCIAQMIDNSHSEPEKVLHEKMNQVMQITSVSSDDAMVALHDCNNDVNAAIDALLEGDDQGEWRETTTKKKKKTATKVQTSKEDSESNKENRRVDNRERSNSRRGSGAPRFRGRGRKGEDSEGGGVGGSLGSNSSRRKGMTNGAAPFSRGRGARGRGASSVNTRTFQKRQPPGFTETIDTWGAPSPEKVENSSSHLQIDNWDDERSGTTEDWDAGEWTGSLEKTTVFGASSSGEPAAVNNHTSGSMIIAEPPKASPPAMITESVTNHALSSNQSQSLNQSIDLAALLQKAAPHSTLGRLPPPSMVDGSSSLTLGIETKSNLLSGIRDPSSCDTSGGNAPQAYSSPSPAAISNSIFSNSISSLGSALSLSSGIAVSKVLSLSPQNSTLASRSKPLGRRLPHASSKIPSSAVEMPEVAMAALDMQFTGLEFGTETFDFTSDVKPVLGSSMVSGSNSSSSVSKDLSGLNSQSQALGPQPIPFPTQASERKSLLTGNQRPNSGGTLVDLSKKDNLSGLVGSSGAASYQSSSTGSGFKSASSFPSPPSAHYSQNQNYSTGSSTGVNSNNSYVGGSNATNSASNNSGVTTGGSGTSQPSGGYGSSFSASASSAQYQNNYVNASSHTLASINVPKSLSGLKDTTQSYNDTVANTGSLSGSLATSASAGVSSGGTGGLPASLNSAVASSVQATKSSVPGKSVNSLGPPGVQQHSGSQTQQQQQQQTMNHQHHLQSQVAQTQQLMAGPSQYVSPQGAMPPPYYNVQQPAMYSFEDLQMLQQRIPHMQTAPTTMTGGRDGSISTPASYSVADAAKFRTDQNSSPVPSTINQQVGAAAGTYITATQNAALAPPFYMYQTMPPVPSNFPQYGTPALIQIPPNTGSSNTQFPGPPKLPYGGSSTYYDSMTQTLDYKTGYGSGSQGQTKTGPNTTGGSASNSANDLASFKNHLGKVPRNYDKSGFHTATPQQTFNLASGSTANAITANYAPMFIPTMPTAAQHHSQLLHHQLHQDGSSSAGQRSASGAGGQSKGGSKGNYSGSYWGN